MERILAVDDDSFFRNLYSELLKSEGYAVDIATSGQEALEYLSGQYYNLVLTELVVPDMSGLELLSLVKQHDPTVDVIIVTSHANVESAIYSLKNGARDYLVKPFNHDEFKHTVALCMEQRKLFDENLELKTLLNVFQVGQTISNCQDMDRLYPLIVDSLAREVGVERGLGFFLTDEGAPELKEFRAFDEEEGRALENMLTPHITSHDSSGTFLVHLDKGAFPGSSLPEGLEEAMILFIRSKNALLGAVALFNDQAKRLPAEINQKNINFMLDQASLALENAARYATAKNLLYVDELTGLNNYRYLDIALEREIKRSDRNSNSVSVLFLDLDLFKNVNDLHGHIIGSRVLKEVGALLKISVREVDTVIRYGGDEYTIILAETGHAGAAIVAERIRSTIESHQFLSDDGYNIQVTACLGYACYPDDTQSKQELLEMADQAMYWGKTRGKNVVFRAITKQDSEQGDS